MAASTSSSVAKKRLCVAIRRASFQTRSIKATRNLPNAIRRGDIKAVQSLIALGADPSVASPDGTSLHDYAIALGHTHIAELIRETLRR